MLGRKICGRYPRLCDLRKLSTTAKGGTEKLDYIIVGSGAAGSVLAKTLAISKPNSKILLLEAGKRRDNYIWFHVPVGYLYTIDNPKSDWMFKTVPEKGLHQRSLLYPRGLGLGGSTLINGMLYIRGQREDYEHWAELTNDPIWGWDNVLQTLKSHEDYHGGPSEMHGAGGPWRVDKIRTNWEILHSFLSAAEKYGIPRSSDFNTGNNYGVGYFDVNQKDGFRQSAYQAFIAKDKPANLQVMSEALVEKLILSDDGSHCLGVSVAQKGSPVVDYTANREVILSAGAIGSVQILERTGIGRGDVLEKAGVKLRKELLGVGENLQDHLQLRLVYKVDNVSTLNTRASTLLGKIKIAWEYATARSGPMASAPSQLGAFFKSSPEEPTPDLEFHVQPLSLPAFGQDLDSFDAFTASVCHVRPTSRGSIHIESKDITAAPKIAPNYLSTDKDQEVAAKAIQATRDVVKFLDSKYNAVEIRPGLQYQSRDELVHAAGMIGTTIFHPAGTCKMGSSTDPMAVVDSKLRVHGISGLRIADCGIMPTIVSGNTSAPTMAIGGICAQILSSEDK